MTRRAMAIAVVVVVAAVLSACVADHAMFGPPLITIVNQSGRSLSNIKLKSQFPQTGVKPIPPGGRRSAVVHPPGESGLEIEFDADGTHVSADDLAYIEYWGGYCVTLQIDEDLHVDSTGGLSCFSLRRVL